MTTSSYEERIPVYAADLIRYLDTTYPHKCPQPGENYEEMWVYAGKRELIDSLLSKLKDTEDTLYDELK